jgi:hypothetical protein
MLSVLSDLVDQARLPALTDILTPLRLVFRLAPRPRMGLFWADDNRGWDVESPRDVVRGKLVGRLSRESLGC